MKKLFGLILFIVLLAPAYVEAQTQNLVMKSFVYHEGAGKYSYMVMDTTTSSCWILEVSENVGLGGFYHVQPSVLDPAQYQALVGQWGSTNEDDAFFQAVFENAALNFTQFFNSVNNQIDD